MKRESSLKQLLEVLVLKGTEKSQSGKNQKLNFLRNSKIFFECLLEITKCLKHEFDSNSRGKFVKRQRYHSKSVTIANKSLKFQYMWLIPSVVMFKI
jgi:hypothetical protein